MDASGGLPCQNRAMMHRRSLIAGAGALAAFPSIASGQGGIGLSLPDSNRRAVAFALANGMQVVVLASARAPVIMHMVWYRVGGADEAPGQSGIAHFLEHLMFKGTKAVPPGEFSRIVARAGGRDNAFTSHDYTGYNQTIAPEHLDLVMGLEADRMANLVISERELLPERNVVLEERRQRVDNSPAAMLDEAVREALYGRKGYGNPVIGWADEVGKLGVAEAEAFHRAHYVPNNAILIVAGDTTPDAVRKLAEKHYGPLQARAVAPRTRPSAGAPDLPRALVRRDPRVREAQWSRDYLAPGYNAGQTKHAFALQVLAQVLGGSQTSRLYRSLVVERQIAVAASAGYSAVGLGLSTFGIGVTPAPLRTVTEIEAAVRDQLARLRDEIPSADEVDRARRWLVASSVYALDSLGSGPRLYGTALTTGRTVADVEAWPARIAAVTPGQVQLAAREALDEKLSVTSLLMPQDAP